jgi:hypothetical protein
MMNHPQALLPRAGVLAFLAGVLLVPPVAASLVVHLDLVSLHARAGTLFHGSCTAKQEFPEAKPFPYTEYTFTVIDAVKGCRDGAGKTLETVTVRHAGTRSGYVRPDGLEVAPLRLGLPEHEVGEEAILFLTRESRLGLSAPVGLTQGKFKVVRKNGTATVKNELGNCGLFEKVDAASFRDLRDEDLQSFRGEKDAIELGRFLKLLRSVKE